MARAFDDGSSQHLELDSPPITAAPFTISAWINSDELTTNQTCIFIGDKDVADNFWALRLSGATGGDPVSFFALDGTTVSAATSSGYSADTDHHICAVETAADDRAVFIDGGSKGTNATSVTPAGADRVAIGRSGDSTPGFYMSGNISEVAIWNVALSDAEVALLAKGFSPLFIQPHNLVAYWPLIRDDDNDRIGGFDLTAINTPTVATHPPLIVYPAFT